MRREPGRLARGALLLGFAALVGKLFAAGEMPKYMTPALDPLTALAGVALAVMGVVDLIGRRDRGEARREQESEAHEHGADPLERGLTCLVALLPVALGLAVTPRALGSSSLGGDQVSSLLLAFAPGASPPASAPPVPVPPASTAAPLDDVPGLLAYLREAGASGTGRRVRATGLMLRGDGLGPGEFALLRFAIAHCVADARPLGLLVVASGAEVPIDRWVEIEGVLAARERDGASLVTIVADRVAPVDEPANPYLPAGL
jgi:putative membrane protein